MRFKAIVLAGLVFAFVRGAAADSLIINNAGSVVMGGVYVGPYNFTYANTSKGTTSTLALVCDDFAHEVYPPGETWTVQVGSNLSAMSYVNSSATLPQEEQVAYLTEALYAHLNNQQTMGDIQWAIWDILDPGISSKDPYSGGLAINAADVSYWLGEALQNAAADYAAGDFSNLVIYTPTSQGSNNDGWPQQYLGLNGPPDYTVPEGGVPVLLAVGLFGLIVAFRRHFAL
jgi:hypothetical protein